MESSTEESQSYGLSDPSVSSVESRPISGVEDTFDLTLTQQQIYDRDPSKWIQYPISLPKSASDSWDRMCSTWQALVSHHPVLRTVILSQKFVGRPNQQMVLRRYAPVKSKNSTEPSAIDDCLQTGWLEQNPSPDDGSKWYLHIHVALIDATSLDLLHKDFVDFYEGGLMSISPSMTDYVAFAQSKDPEAANEFWKSHLGNADLAPLYTVPYAHSPLMLSCCMSFRLFESEVQIHQQCDVSRPCVLAIWALVIAMHAESGNDVVAFETSGRDQTFNGWSSVVGCADQTYPLKLTLDRSLDLKQWVKVVAETDALSAEHAFIGPGAIREQASHKFHPQTRIVFTGSSTESRPLDHHWHQMDVHINYNDWSVVINHASSISQAKVRVIFDHFKTALLSASRNPNGIIGDITMVSDSERKFILEKSAARTAPAEGLVHKLFEKQVALTPEAHALQFEGDEPISYDRLNRLANAVARQLVCGRGHYIPLCIQRSANLIIALLAVLKTGAAYVPMDVEIPKERLRFIAQDVNAPFVIVDKDSSETFANEVSIESLLEKASCGQEANLEIWQSSSDIVYVIYTSGSTGSPKGVLLEHEAAFTGLVAFPTLPELRQLLFHNPVFSAAQRSIFSTLKQGGCLCIASKENITVFIQDTINQMKINTIDVTPSTATLITPGTVPCLRRMTVAGELINPALIPDWIDRLELLNAYGLSENTQFNWRQIMKSDLNPQNIGRPSDSTTSYVMLPGTQTLAPLLVPGELCLGGHQLARGYLNRPEKTREAFFPNPFSPGRLYRTGDMVITQENGSIELIGRIDFQVKINDQRVEPGEPNAILQVQEQVSSSVVVSARVSGRKALVAVVVPQHNTALGDVLRNLQNTLAQQLPRYMIPSYWLERKELPLNINGKVDIPALQRYIESLDPEELLAAMQGPKDNNEPVTQMEQKIRQIVSEQLSLPSANVSLQLSFTDLGGSSLDSIALVSRLTGLGLTISFFDVLSSDSLREIAAKLCKIEKSLTSPVEPFSLLKDCQAITRDDLNDAYPATPFQQGVLADTILDQAGHVYTRVYKMSGVSANELKNAFTTVLAKHEILRTSFFPYHRSFLQVVRKHVEVLWTEHDEPVEKYVRRVANSQMDTEGSLLQVAVLSNRIFALSLHHALHDYWSNQFVVDDLNAVLLGKELPARTPFNRFVEFLETRDSTNSRAFWKSYLSDAAPCRITDKPLIKTGRESLGGLITSHSVTHSNLQHCATKIGVTLGALVHSAWAVTLALLTGMDDILFMTNLSGRDIPLEGILSVSGPTVFTVPIRVRLTPSDKLEDIARGLQRNLQELSQNAYIGLRSISHECGLPRDFTDTMVNFTVKPTGKKEDVPLQQLNLTERFVYTQYITFETTGAEDFLVHSPPGRMNKTQELLHIAIETLHEFVQSPASALEDFRKKRSERAVQRDTVHHDLAHNSFEKVAALNPLKVALRDNKGAVMTYGELETKANQLGTFLRSRKILPKDRVPLYMEKSFMTIVSIFGILKAGASFVPLDPRNPHDRNRFIIKDIGAKVLITDRMFEQAGRELGKDTLVVDNLDLGESSCSNMEINNANEDDLAYVIYTSGSTGLPKGVLVSHRAVTAATEGMIEATGVNASWVSLWVLNYVFDASYYDVFTVLSTGGILCLAPQDVIISNIAEIVNQLNIKQLMLTPTIARLLSPAQVPKLQVLNVCGEPITAEIANEWAREKTVYNGYGPTEATILMTINKVEPNGNLRNIGRPLKHVEAMILDSETLEMVDHEEIGELCLSGPQLAEGYLGRQDLTEQAFIETLGGRIYRTGDLARWTKGGDIECFGRKDSQVKINGYRIELEEIEYAVSKLPDIQGCVVEVVQVESKRQLAAFCVFTEFDGEPIADDSLLLSPYPAGKLRALHENRTTLAHYMIPSMWVPMKSIPLLSSGKTDRRLLRELAERLTQQDINAYSAQEEISELRPVDTFLEKTLQLCWSDVLDIPQGSIGALSTFTSLGGDSITAINLVSILRRKGYSITVHKIISNPVLELQAKLLKSNNNALAKDLRYEISPDVYNKLQEAEISRSDIEDIYPCGPGQIEFLTQGRKGKQFWQLTTDRLLPKNFDLEKWLEATKELTRRNQILRAMYLKSTDSDPQSWVQIVLKKPILDFTIATYKNETEKRELVANIRDGFFQLGKPFIKYVLLSSVVDGTRSLCIKVDHASYDGTLLRILDDQFTAITKGLPIDKPSEFKTFIDWNQRVDKTSVLSFWTSLLSNLAPSRPLMRRPEVSATIFGVVDSEVYQAASRSGVTPSIVFQAAYTLLLGHLNASEDVLYDNLLTGRNAEVDNPQLINGTCANFLPFRLGIDGEMSVNEFLQNTQSVFWSTTEHGVVGLGDIFNALDRDRDTYSAKTLFCYQPFNVPSGERNPMRWVVLADSKVFMTVNYAIMFEVSKARIGYRLKMQFDETVFSKSSAEHVLTEYTSILSAMIARPDEMARHISQRESPVRGTLLE